MAMFDLSLDKLREYRPEVAAPADLVDFWRRSIEKARTDDLSATFTLIDNKLAVIDTYDVTYAGFDGSPVKGWLHVPACAHSVVACGKPRPPEYPWYCTTVGNGPVAPAGTCSQPLTGEPSKPA